MTRYQDTVRTYRTTVTTLPICCAVRTAWMWGHACLPAAYRHYLLAVYQCVPLCYVLRYSCLERTERSPFFIFVLVTITALLLLQTTTTTAELPTDTSRFS